MWKREGELELTLETPVLKFKHIFLKYFLVACFQVQSEETHPRTREKYFSDNPSKL